MEKAREVLRLVKEYEEKIRLALELLKQKFGNINFLLAKNIGQIPKSGFLDDSNKIKYNFHGIGCEIDFGEENVNFDFHFGFNEWVLDYFLKKRKNKYPLLTNLEVQELRDLLNILEREGRITRDKEFNVYHLQDFQK